MFTGFFLRPALPLNRLAALMIVQSKSNAAQHHARMVASSAAFETKSQPVLGFGAYIVAPAKIMASMNSQRHPSRTQVDLPNDYIDITLF